MLGETFNLTQAGRIYFDHNATTPLAQVVQKRTPEWLREWGNPSSIHLTGRGPKAIIRESRKNIAELIGCHPLEIIFTSGGSEANNLALKGFYDVLKDPTISSPVDRSRNEFIVSSIEHPSVAKTFDYLESQGAVVHRIPVRRDGFLDMEFYKKKLSEKTALVSVMYANNETGNIFPIQELVKMAHEAGALFHCDAVQALGKDNVDLQHWGVDMASFSGHKFYALKGCGLLYVKSGSVLASQIYGGGQERHRRAGTENTLAIASLGEVANYKDQVSEEVAKVKVLRDFMQEEILENIEACRVNGLEAPRVGNTLSLIIDGVDGESLLMNLDIKGYSVSTGAACSAGNPEPSPVLLAMGLSREEAQSSLRLSLGWGNTEEEIKKFVEDLKQVVERLRHLKKQSGEYL